MFKHYSPIRKAEIIRDSDILSEIYGWRAESSIKQFYT